MNRKVLSECACAKTKKKLWNFQTTDDHQYSVRYPKRYVDAFNLRQKLELFTIFPFWIEIRCTLETGRKIETNRTFYVFLIKAIFLS